MRHTLAITAIGDVTVECLHYKHEQQILRLNLVSYLYCVVRFAVSDSHIHEQYDTPMPATDIEEG